MVVTRSQADQAELEERRREEAARAVNPNRPVLPVTHTDSPQSPSLYAQPSSAQPIARLSLPRGEAREPNAPVYDPAFGREDGGHYMHSTARDPSTEPALSSHELARSSTSREPEPTARTGAIRRGGPSAERRPTVAFATGAQRTSPAASRCSTNTALRMRQAEREAEEKLLEISRRQLELEKQMIQTKLASQLDLIEAEGSQRGSILGDPEPVQRVDNWLEQCELNLATTPLNQADRMESTPHREPRVLTHTEQLPVEPTPRHEPRAAEQTPARGRSSSASRSIAQLAEAIEKMTRQRPPPRQVYELPAFSGAPGEWLPFQRAYEESTKTYSFTAAENMARMRSCLKGAAREVTLALLHTTNDPDLVMQTLRQCYGRPEIIVDKALDDLKRLPRLGSTAADLNVFAVRVQNIVTVLASVDKRGYLHNPLLTREILERMTPHLRSRFCDYAFEHAATADPEVVVLSKFLMREADRALRFTYTTATAGATTRTAQPPIRQELKAPMRMNSGVIKRPNPVYAAEQTDACLCCGGSHATVQCRRLHEMPVDSRWEWAKENRICFKCMSKKHRREHCRARGCDAAGCPHPHHRLLHQQAPAPRNQAPAPCNEAPPSRGQASPPRSQAPAPRAAQRPRTPEDPEKVPASSSASVATTTDVATAANTVLLKIVPVTIAGPKATVNTFALLDEGSTVSLIDHDLAQEIGATGPVAPLWIQGVGAASHQAESQIVKAEVRGRTCGPSFNMKLRTVRNLRLHKQMIREQDLRGHAHLAGLEEACFDVATPRLLIGADYWYAMVPKEIRAGRLNEPAAALTELGWVIYGSTPRRSSHDQQTETALHLTIRDAELNDLLKFHFSVDSLGVVATKKIRPQDKRATDIFEKTVKRVNGSYEVGQLWRGSERTKAPQTYRMTSMIFGAASSPFLAHSVRNHNAYAHANDHPDAVEDITKNHYMDDLVASYKTEAEAIHRATEIAAVHSKGGFQLRGWTSNSRELRVRTPPELRADGPTQLGGKGLKVLGMYWDPEGDTLGFNTTLIRVPAEVRELKRGPTKREALSAVMSIYDPLGLIAHYTVTAKIQLQRLWGLKLGWDEPLPTEEREEFTKWLRAIEHVAALHVPRPYYVTGGGEPELHVFVDASEQAYVASAYWKCENQVSLVAAKAKVAPRKPLSIPRLELQAAVIGARLGDIITREHRYKVNKKFYWTDSKTVLLWIRDDARRYSAFVSHRLGEIAELTEPEQWRWVPTQSNPADDATRADSTRRILNTDRWYTGPDFLRLPESEWPQEEPQENVETSEACAHVSLDPSCTSLPDLTRFSKYEKLIRTTARVLCFVDKCRKRATEMTLQHLQRAEHLWYRRCQEEDFPNEIRVLSTGGRLNKNSKLFSLDPVLNDGILKMRGRINAAPVPSINKAPVILDGRNPFVRLLVSHAHIKAAHSSNERVVNDLKQQYWVLRLRPTVRAVAHACRTCRLRRARPSVPALGDLPLARIEPYCRPFTNCGVDYFGPVTVTIGRRHEKRWVALFTCLTTRAVHLELAASLTTDSAIMALRRMAARRGWPRVIYSDNGTNFRGADTELRAAYEEWLPSLRDYALQHRAEWRFIPPGAPNQGGAWERLVRSVKTALAVTLQCRAPKEEVLLTLLTEAEHTVNARPLTHVSVDPRDGEALTPNHFLLGSSTGAPITGPYDEADRRTWRASQALADLFWARWVREYLPTLAPRRSPSGRERQLQIGDLVVVVDHNSPRNVWPRGIVEAIYPGPDGGVRSADIRTRGGVYRRPTTRLAVLTTGEEVSTGGLDRGETVADSRPS